MKHLLVVSNTIELVRLYAEDIVCIEADGNYSTFILVGGDRRLVLFQLGQLERMMGEQLAEEAGVFVRVGRSLIVNCNYIHFINLNRQQLLLRDTSHHQHETQKASLESLKKLKEFIEGNNTRKEDNGQGTV